MPAGIDGVEGSSSGVASRGNSDCSGAREGGAVEEEDAAEETAPRSDAPCASSCESIAAVVRLSEKREGAVHTRAQVESVREREQKEERACRERRGDKAARHEIGNGKKRAAALACLRLMLRRVAVVRSSRALRGDAIVIVIVLALRADGPLAAAGARRLQAAAVLAGLLLHAGAAKLGLVPAIWAAAAVGSPAALTGAAPQHAVDLDDRALAGRGRGRRAVRWRRRQGF